MGYLELKCGSGREGRPVQSNGKMHAHMHKHSHLAPMHGGILHLPACTGIHVRRCELSYCHCQYVYMLTSCWGFCPVLFFNRIHFPTIIVTFAQFITVLVFVHSCMLPSFRAHHGCEMPPALIVGRQRAAASSQAQQMTRWRQAIGMNTEPLVVLGTPFDITDLDAAKQLIIVTLQPSNNATGPHPIVVKCIDSVADGEI